ncbi:Ionotropic receptor 103 [Halyomorpha halys]|nr:Ionotropic receptor 103 [Halyomorpha halys]
MTLALLCSVCNALTVIHEVPPYVWDLLGSNIVVTPQALSMLPTINKPYYLLDRREVIHKEITGAIVSGDDLFIGIQFAWLTFQRGWYPRAAVVVLAEKVNYHMFCRLWSVRIVNVVVLTTTGLYIYNPFLQSIISVGEHVSQNLTDRWKDLQGIKIPISVYENPVNYIAESGISLGSGLDGSALYELAKYWNMTVELRVNKKMNDSERQVLWGKSDISFTGRSLLQNSYGLQFTSVVYGDRVCVIVRLPPKLRGWDVLLRIYDWKVYVVFFTVLVLTNKAFRLLAKRKNRKNALDKVMRSMTNIAIARPPTAFPERIILSSSMILGLIIVTIYQASMFHFVRQSVRHNKMKTLLEVFKSEIPLRTNEIGLRDFFLPWEPKEIRKLGKKLKEDVNINNALKSGFVATREKYYHLLRDANLLQKDFYVLKQRVGSFTMAYTVKKGSPFLEPLTKFTLRIFEAGLYRKWRRMTVAKMARRDDTNEETSIPRSLHMSDTEVAFVVLLIGHGLAFVVFLLELLVKNWSRIRFQKFWSFLKTVFDIIFC